MEKKRNLLVIGGIVLIAVLLLVLVPLFRSNPSSDTVLITVDGKEYGRYSLYVPREIVIETGEGESNTVVISNGGVYMKEATCKDQLCVQQGEVTPANCSSRALGADIICLPHRIVVTLDVPEAQDLPDTNT